jgi:hypothetical protein
MTLSKLLDEELSFEKDAGSATTVLPGMGRKPETDEGMLGDVFAFDEEKLDCWLGCLLCAVNEAVGEAGLSA